MCEVVDARVLASDESFLLNSRNKSSLYIVSDFESFSCLNGEFRIYFSFSQIKEGTEIGHKTPVYQEIRPEGMMMRNAKDAVDR